MTIQATLEIHASRLDDYADCPLRGFASLMSSALKERGYQINEQVRYITPEVGTAIHAGVAQMHENKRNTAGFNIPNVIARKELQAILNEDTAIRFTEKMPDLDYIHKHMDDFLAVYYRDVLRLRPAKLIEYGLEGQLAPNITYKTTLDLFTEDDILADLKSGAKITPAYNQLGFYLLLLMKQGYKPRRAILDYILPDKSTKVYTHKPIEYNVDNCLFIVKQTLTSLIGDFEVFCQTGKLDHIQINPRSAACNKALCPLWGTSTCHLWKK